MGRRSNRGGAAATATSTGAQRPSSSSPCAAQRRRRWLARSLGVGCLAVGAGVVVQLDYQGGLWGGRPPHRRSKRLLESLGRPGRALWLPPSAPLEVEGGEGSGSGAGNWNGRWIPPYVDQFSREDAVPAASLAPAYERRMLWGTYRPSTYFGFKTRTFPSAVVGGIMWHGDDPSKLRHEARDGELGAWGWLKHDGVSYGQQELRDDEQKILLNVAFVKPLYVKQQQTDSGQADSSAHDDSTQLAVRIQVQSASNATLFFYAGVSEDKGIPSSSALPVACGHLYKSPKMFFALDAADARLGDAQITFAAFPSISNVTTSVIRLNHVEGAEVRAKRRGSWNRSDGDSHDDIEEECGGGAMLAMSGRGTWHVDFIVRSTSYESSGSDDWVYSHQLVTDWLLAGEHSFDERFEAVYGLGKLKRIGLAELGGIEGDDYVAAGAAALSNTLGSMGYFFGSVPITGSKEQSFAAPLFTCVPSRGFFPRGFLWDEGFHQLLVSHWDPDLSFDVLSHWMNVLHASPYNRGHAWLPREQARGAEAAGKVPREFLEQSPLVANPPTFMLVVLQLLDLGRQNQIASLAASLDAWLRWLLVTLGAHSMDGSFQWRGRDPEDARLNALTLASGLDDYPRASSPTEDEKHLDALCWMALACRVMGKLQSQLPADAPPYESLAKELASGLSGHHYSDDGFWDVGFNVEEAIFASYTTIRCQDPSGGSILDVHVPLPLDQRKARAACPASHPKFLFPLGDGRGGLLTHTQYESKDSAATELRFVKHRGYVSLFPLLLMILEPNCDELGEMLGLMRDPEQLWSPHGLRSLSRSDAFYRQPNSSGDDPYWRGAIWVNINYLALSALHGYANGGGRWSKEAGKIYEDLRRNILRTVLGEFKRTGFYYEQYDDESGLGMRSHPFTGWTAIVLNIMTEKYPMNSLLDVD